MSLSSTSISASIVDMFAIVIKVAWGFDCMPGTARSPASTLSCAMTPSRGEVMVTFENWFSARSRTDLSAAMFSTAMALAAFCCSMAISPDLKSALAWAI